MNWTAQGFLILSKFFAGYGGGFFAVGGYASQTNPAEVTLWNLIFWPSIAGLAFVFPQLTKTFSEAARTKKK